MDFEEGLEDLYIILFDENEGLLYKILKTDYNKKYEGWDSLEAFECMEDEISRVWKLILWHDMLVDIPSSMWKFLASDDVHDFPIKFRETEWLVRLTERIETELSIRRLGGEKIEDNCDAITVAKRNKALQEKKLLVGFCDYLIESVPYIEYLEKDNVNRLSLIESYLEGEVKK